MRPLVAIVGRPNVGKSTLFNRLVRKRSALVADEPGLTRDRHYGTARWEGRRFDLVDTGGFESDAEAGAIEGLIRAQTEMAVDEADLVLLVADARAGLTGADEDLSSILRRASKPTLFVANKVDGPKQADLAHEFYSLGFDPVFPVSAEHGPGLDELIDAILAALESAGRVELDDEPEPVEDEGFQSDEGDAALADDDAGDDDPDDETGAGEGDLVAAHKPVAPQRAAKGARSLKHQPLRIALVGRPNAGKSALLNRLVGAPRSIVSAIPGTTRDPVDVELQHEGQQVVVVDTAGIRRKRRSGPAMEQISVIRALRAVNDADVACLLIDSSEEISGQEARIANMALDAGRGLVLVFTKSDLAASTRAARRKIEEQIRDKLHFVDFAPYLLLSAQTGYGVAALLPKVLEVYAQTQRRITTSELNRFLEATIHAHGPAALRGRHVKLLYITQARVAPPTFVVSVNYPEGVQPAYRRYLQNRLREVYGFDGVPLRVLYRERKRSPKKGRAQQQD